MRKPEFESGDQDYASARGWDPDKEMRDRIIAEAKKRDPKAFAPMPELLRVLPADECVEMAAGWVPMKQLFGSFWLAEEVAVLYSTPGVGKSALVVQLAESLARGIPFAPFDKPMPGCEVPPLRVLYIDCELTMQQFTRRYSTLSEDGSKIEDPYQFSPNLLRAELQWDGRLIDGYEDFTDMLFTDIDNNIERLDADVLICDNITFLSHSSTANSAIAFRLMNRLQELKKLRHLSILAVAHTPKRRPHVPLTERDLQGSIDLAKVADSMFAIGSSSLSPDLRYIKQTKSRSGRIEHDGRNVLIYRLGKFDFAAESRPEEEKAHAENFFGYSFVGTDNDQVHLPAPFRPLPAKRRSKLDQSRVMYAKLLARQGLSSAAIAHRLGVGKSTAHRYVENGGKNARPA